ncbi:hypothetical protein F4779DRAFT_625669 [Xylariaceae sp. FL0662B]|nr:hypothetical protein F4779DRAFT_625669 [Xylariaceae sp. FL0662B]
MAAQDPNAPTDSNGDALVITAAVMLTLTWLSVFLRSYVRAFLTKGFQSDDWFMLAAQANFTTSCTLILRGVYYGVGRHNQSLDQYDEIQGLKYQALATATYVSNMWLIKLSIGIFLLRLANHKRYTYTLYASIAIVTVWSLVLFFWNIFQCDPVEAQWDYTILKNVPDSHCVSTDEIINAAYALSVMTILSDWLYALLPIPMIWNVKMTAQAKLTVVVVLGMGIFASIATLVRLKFLSDLADMADILHAGTDAMVWTLIEPGVAIVASSLVTIRPLLRIWKVKGFNTTGHSRQIGPFSNGQPASRTNRSSKMPGFGSTDVTLVDVELGHTKSVKSVGSDAGTIGKSHRSRHSRSHMSKVPESPLEEDEEAFGRTRYEDGGFRRIEIKSEMYVIEGNTTPTPPPSAHGGDSGAWLSSEQASLNGSSHALTASSAASEMESPTRAGEGPYLSPPPRAKRV